MVYDPTTTYSIVFGGTTSVDSGTRQAYDLNETWAWTGTQWVQIRTAHAPTPRSSYGMVFDTRLQEAILFGGVTRTNPVTGTTDLTQLTDLNDTWAFDGTDWTQIPTANAPSPRIVPGMAYDPVRGVTVLFGGEMVPAPTAVTPSPIPTFYYDTWEFDGTNWTETVTDGPQVSTPSMTVPDASPPGQILMIGGDSKSVPHMYRYVPAGDSSASWTEIKPATMPPCVANANMTYQASNQKVVFYGGICTGSSAGGDTWEWDGTNWTSVTTGGTIIRLGGEAIDYDAYRGQTLMFGGVSLLGAAQSATYNYIKQSRGRNGGSASVKMPQRSRCRFKPIRSTPESGRLGGLEEGAYVTDFWRYHDQQWASIPFTTGPISCDAPLAAFDSNRQKLVLVCEDSSTFEWDGTAWTGLTNLKKLPPTRRFSSMVYDQSLKKVVLFGGWDDATSAYLNETWLWDGAAWTQETKNLPPRRHCAGMWYDPVLRKTVIFGGLGQSERMRAIDRFNDMWSFDGSGWKQITPTNAPGARYASQVAVDPHQHSSPHRRHGASRSTAIRSRRSTARIRGAGTAPTGRSCSLGHLTGRSGERRPGV